MTALFDAWHLGEASWDVACAGWTTPQGIAARQQERLAALLDAAGASALCRRHLRGRAGRDVALDTLPVMHKRDLMRRFGSWVADPRLRLAALRAFTADPGNIARPFLDRYQVWESSGTSGEPAIFVQDARAMAVYDALEGLRRCARPGGWVDPMLLGERIAFVGATSGHFASYVSMLRLCQLNPWMAQSLRCFSIADPIGVLVEALNRFAPTVLATYPTSASMLADEAARGALRLRLREIWTGGEDLREPVRQRVAQVLGCPVRNSYGASEFLAIGWECAAGAMHANADWVILEPVDRHYRPVPPGTLSHSTLLTNLANHVQPLIRYDLGDRITVAAAPCSCGSPLPVIAVQGRNDDALRMAGRSGRPVTLLPLALSTVLEDDAGVFDFQLCQRDAHTLALRLGQRGAGAAAAAARCRRVLQDFAARQGLEPIRVVHETGSHVRRGRSGKVQRVVAMPAD